MRNIHRYYDEPEIGKLNRVPNMEKNIAGIETGSKMGPSSNNLVTWLRFITIFAAILFVVEYVLTANSNFHQYLETQLVNNAISPVITAITISLSTAIFTFLLIIIIFACIEFRKGGNIITRYKNGIVFTTITITFSIFIQAISYYIFEYFGITPLIAVNQLGPYQIIIPLVYLLIIGLMEYWLHRALHENKFLWRFHSIHHQIEHLNAANSYSHFGEVFLYLILITTPLILLVDQPQSNIAFVTIFYLISNYYMHSDSKLLSFPAPLRHIFADNIYHHYHHSTNVQHWGKNYASFLSFYDRIFGTQYMPDQEIFPVTGVEGYRPLNSIKDYAIRPFKKDIEN